MEGLNGGGGTQWKMNVYCLIACADKPIYKQGD